MRRLALTLVLPATLILIASAQAGSVPDAIAKVARAQITVPSEWDGIWTTEDSLYTCEGVFQSTSAGADTICGGKDYTASAGNIQLVCTGTADATTIDVTCTGSGPLFTDCDANYDVVTHGTRTGDTFFIVTTVNLTYTGAACGLLPPSCVQVNSHGTRTSPAPAAFCLTPTKRSTWGQIKTIYR